MTDSATTPTTRPSPDDRGRIVPLCLVYEAHGFHGPSLDLRLDGDRVVFHRSQGGYYCGATKPLVVVPTLEQWSAFRRELDEIRVWSWKRNYSPPPEHLVCDGVNWEIEIRYADRRRRSSGYHGSPDGYGRFLDALARLLGLEELEGEPFGDEDAGSQEGTEELPRDGKT